MFKGFGDWFVYLQNKNAALCLSRMQLLQYRVKEAYLFEKKTV